MTDLEITRLCAEAMGLDYIERDDEIMFRKDMERDAFTKVPMYRNGYGPLHDDAQAMALVKKFKLNIFSYASNNWGVSTLGMKLSEETLRADLNRAICECVAKLKQGEG